MENLVRALELYGLQIVFVGVLLDQGGLPFPSFSLVIVAAAVATNSGAPVWPIFAIAVIATLIADLLWFAGGRRFGAAMLRMICRVSLSPDSCVGNTRRIYTRWGAPSLIVAKYVPGLAAVATTLAGETGVRTARFALYDGIGAALWAGGAIALGVIFHEAIDAVLDELELLGNSALVLLAAAVLVFVAVKWWQRWRFKMRIRMARISAAELVELLRTTAKIMILDARTEDSRQRTGWIPGSVWVSDTEQLALGPYEEVVVYCDCPNDATAAMVAKRLHAKGILHVRPLAGGLEAWLGHGGTIEGLPS
ncbi:MAG TPA: rhodanese-like domain-containing protein [Steroidobacteraceae bacterium]|jgi:membrane protein DedA with SNARE-associated domain/rhodanese-related sulfurtransferase